MKVVTHALFHFVKHFLQLLICEDDIDLSPKYSPSHKVRKKRTPVYFSWSGTSKHTRRTNEDRQRHAAIPSDICLDAKVSYMRARTPDTKEMKRRNARSHSTKDLDIPEGHTSNRVLLTMYIHPVLVFSNFPSRLFCFTLLFGLLALGTATSRNM